LTAENDFLYNGSCQPPRLTSAENQVKTKTLGNNSQSPDPFSQCKARTFKKWGPEPPVGQQPFLPPFIPFGGIPFMGITALVPFFGMAISFLGYLTQKKRDSENTAPFSDLAKSDFLTDR